MANVGRHFCRSSGPTPAQAEALRAGCPGAHPDGFWDLHGGVSTDSMGNLWKCSLTPSVIKNSQQSFVRLNDKEITKNIVSWIKWSEKNQVNLHPLFYYKASSISFLWERRSPCIYCWDDPLLYSKIRVSTLKS